MERRFRDFDIGEKVGLREYFRATDHFYNPLKSHFRRKIDKSTFYCIQFQQAQILHRICEHMSLTEIFD